MPTIEVTPEQAQALARGESVTLAPEPEPARLFNASIILRGGLQQRWHRHDLAGKDDHHAAAQWVRCLGHEWDYDGAIIAVCERIPGDRPYFLDTVRTRYFRVKRDSHGMLVVRPGV